jgi:PBSX family phage terminase large subunit
VKQDIQNRLNRLKAAREAQRAAKTLLEHVDITEHIADVYRPVHADIAAGGHQYYNLPGGRGSCKSSFVSLEIVAGIMQDQTGQSSAIVFRRVGGTLRDSVYSQIGWAIDTLGVSHLWQGGVSPMQYTYRPTGAQIVFRGLDDATKLKSIKPAKGAFRFVWFEEFAELSGPNMVRSVMQSVVRGGKGFTVFRSFNPPISAANWANQLVAQPDERALTLLTNYTQVPPAWLGDSFLYEAQRLKEINPTAYEHEYMGIPTGTGGEVFPNIVGREITGAEIEQLEYVYAGLDFGFAVDPACFIRAAYDRRSDTVFLLDEIYMRSLSNAELAAKITERGYQFTGRIKCAGWDERGPEKAVITCDCAEPKSIADLQAQGLKAVPCRKFSGCVAYRIKWLQHRKITIDPKRTPNAYREFTAYSYNTDKDGNFLSRLPDRDNHAIDALAYALDSLIYSRLPA